MVAVPKENGFTLIEIAIVVVIIGLLLGGILKGQEMIANAKAHSLISTSTGMKASIAMFMDRYRSYPGDYDRASSNIPGLTPVVDDGDGNRILGGDPDVALDIPAVAIQRAKEAALAWKQLSASGVISGNYDGLGVNIGPDVNAPDWGWNCPGSTCLANGFNSSFFLIYDNEQYGFPVGNGQDQRKSEELWTGRSVSVQVLQQMDIKLDDGNPATGQFRAADFFEKSLTNHCTAPVANQPNAIIWNVSGQAADCGGVHLM